MSKPATQTGRFKVGLSAVLADECQSPFALSDFEAFLKKEHSDENLEFWRVVLAYRDLAVPLFPQTILNARRITSTSSLRGSTTSLARGSAQSPSTLTPTTPISPDGASSTHSSTSVIGPPGEADSVSDVPQLNDAEAAALKEKLKVEIEKLISLYLTPGGDREVNLPAVTRKKIVSEVKEKGNYHPDIFATAMEQTYQLMKTSSYPQFYKQAQAAATAAGRPIGERRITAPAASGAAQ